MLYFRKGLSILASLLLSCAALTASGKESSPATPKKGDESLAEPSNNGGKERNEKSNKEKEAVLDLTGLSIEELMATEVTSVTRSKGHTLFDSPAAVHIISPEDIRRTGHQHLAEMLRLVPGTHVARINAHTWAAAARGFNGRFNRHQLVQMDGRSLYTPVFSGVNWATQDTVIEDLEKVEVIRGPGATLWGANAVNGIINFQTKDAKDTQGLLVAGRGGTEEGGSGTVRYGGKITDQLHFRVYGKHVEHARSATKYSNYSDDWRRSQAGARFDWAHDKNHVTWQGDLYRTQAGESHPISNQATGITRDQDGEDEYRGYNGLVRWTHEFTDAHSIQVQTYLDFAQVKQPHPGIGNRQDLYTFDLDFKHVVPIGTLQKIVWGLNYRLVDFDFSDGPTFTRFDPSGRTLHTFSGFVQDTFTAIPDRLWLTVGTKLEQNPFTHFEVQPSFKTTFKVHQDHVLWGGVSRALRIPDLFDNDISVIASLGVPGSSLTLTGNPSLEAEEVISFEFGYRTQPVDWFSLDVTAFHNRFDNLLGLTSTTLVPFPPTVQVTPNNDQAGEAHGIEMAANFRITRQLRLSAHYSWFDFNASGPSGDALEGQSAANLAHARLFFDIRKDLELNAVMYYTDNTPNPTTPGVRPIIGGVDAYIRADLGLTWRPPVDNLEVSIWGTNLTDQAHKEYGPDGSLTRGGSKIRRGFFGKVTWKF